MNTGLKLAVLSVGLFMSHTTLAQPANDDCSNATNLGVLPNPAPCPAEFGTVVTNNYTTVGATGENPYTYMTNCLGAPGPNDDMYSPAADVWNGSNSKDPRTMEFLLNPVPALTASFPS